MKTELTPYQQSLVNKGENSTRTLLIALVLIGLTALFGVGFFAQANDTLPSYLSGWLFFGTLVLGGFQWIGALCLLFVSGILCIARWLVEESKKDPWDGDKSKSTVSSNRLVMELTKETRLLVGQKWYYKLLDTGADLFLFVALVTANHPILAMFYGLGALAVYLCRNIASNQLMKCVLLMEDPLDADPNLNVDELIDKLVDPESEKKQ